MMRKIFWALGAILIAGTLFPRLVHAQEPANISILHTADTHGHLLSFYHDSSKPVGGIAKRAIFFQEKRRHTHMNWLTLDAGDAISGTPLSDVFEGYLDIQAMNKLQYDAMVLGVHEFDYGIAVLKQRISEATFPVLCANLFHADTGALFTTPHTIVERNGIRIAIVGLTTNELPNRVAPENFAGLRVEDPIETARRLIPQLRSQADVVVALTHLGLTTDITLASQVQDIDVIVGGMSHAQLRVPMKVQRTLIVHAPQYGHTVGLLKLSFDQTPNRWTRRYFSSVLEPMAGKWLENTDYLEWLNSFQPAMAERMNRHIGSGATRLTSLKATTAETDLGNYVCDTLRAATNADVAILPAQFFQADLPEGPVYLGDLYSALPYEHYAVVLPVTGGELQEILNDGAAQLGTPNFPQVSGVTFNVYNGQAYDIRIRNVELDLFAQYQLVTTDALAEGNYGYATLGTIAQCSYTGRLVRDIVRQRLASGEVAMATVDVNHKRIALAAQRPATYGTSPATTLDTSVARFEEVPEEMPATQPQAEQPPASDTGTQPASTVPTEQPPVTAAPGETPIEPATTSEQPTPGETPPEGAESPSILDSMRYDRTGQPIDEPVVIEDVAVSDPALQPPVTPPPATETPPSEVPPTPPAEQPPLVEETSPPETLPATPPSSAPTGTIVGQSTLSEGGLDYLFKVIRTTDGYEFQLQMTNASAAPLEIHYDTGETFNFITSFGTEPVWDYNANLFFMQSSITRTMAPGESISVAAPWNGCDYAGMPLAPQTYRLETVHLTTGNPVRISFDAALPQ